LIVIDPLSAYFGRALDSYRDSDVRSVLEPVTKLAERRQVSVLGIMHVGKATDRKARYRALGSVAFVNAARLVFAIGPDPDDPQRRLLVPVKANLCREAPPLAFRLEDADGIARVVWDSAPVPDISADTVLSGQAVVDDDERQTAEDLLRQLLADEPWPLAATAVAAAGRAHGVHVRSLQRAAHRLGITIRKSGFRNGWFWFRPTAEDDTAPSPCVDVPHPSPKPPAEDDEGASVFVVSSSTDVSSSTTSKTTLSSSSSSQYSRQNIPRCEDDSGGSTRAREDPDDLPACLRDLVEPDYSDPIGEHDEP
jgi:hypothetical protein